MRLLLDTNVIIDFLKQGSSVVDLPLLFSQHECFVSVIVKLELLKHPDITPDEEHTINEFLRLVPVAPINAAIENETIALSRLSKLKLPDAIIGATAIVYDAEIVTHDPHFLKCSYERVRIWNRP
ncbi:MAG: type II toxin-antitoxin system VapC family toxin [Treponema sp.]|nr:type II toxin-antitoxin system VapC family toxin [Treponema sp.]